MCYLTGLNFHIAFNAILESYKYLPKVGGSRRFFALNRLMTVPGALTPSEPMCRGDLA
jgi:hypothetical protein